MEGADPSSLANKVAKVAGSINPGESASPASLGMAAGASVLETVKELAKDNDSSKEKNQVQPGKREFNSLLTLILSCFL